MKNKIIALYALGSSARDIANFIYEQYGVEISDGFVSDVTDRILYLAKERQNQSTPKSRADLSTVLNQFAIAFEDRCQFNKTKGVCYNKNAGESLLRNCGGLHIKFRSLVSNGEE
ncbi:hypothetical protein FACS1894125_2950 [Actinomycetota bacterium]|nr:hypothetical protein FACS1894125_2950 [Actinomycetota bacterium]